MLYGVSEGGPGLSLQSPAKGAQHGLNWCNLKSRVWAELFPLGAVMQCSARVRLRKGLTGSGLGTDHGQDAVSKECSHPGRGPMPTVKGHLQGGCAPDQAHQARA